MRRRWGSASVPTVDFSSVTFLGPRLWAMALGSLAAGRRALPCVRSVMAPLRKISLSISLYILSGLTNPRATA